MQIKFDIEKARQALANDSVALAFMEEFKARFQSLTEADVWSVMLNWVAFNYKGAVTTFYNLDQQAEAMVTGSADVANRQAEFKERVLAAAAIFAALAVRVLIAGVVL
jgi:hypothetical protein